MKTIGVLAVQGDFEKHRAVLSELGRTVVMIRSKPELEKCDALIIPGGESTTLMTVMKKHLLWEPTKEFVKSRPTLGTCAGSIILASTVIDMQQETLNAVDIDIQRNAYGRQVDSFIDDVQLHINGKKEHFEGVFIRAPKIVRLGENVVPLAWHGGNAVLVEQDHLLAATFHPELTGNNKIHKYFLNKVDRM